MDLPSAVQSSHLSPLGTSVAQYSHMRVTTDKNNIELISRFRVVQPGDATNLTDLAVVTIGQVSQRPRAVYWFMWIGDAVVVNSELLLV